MSAISEASERQVRKASAGRPAQYLVLVRGEEVGLIEKYRDTRTETHPWKAFYPIGMQSRMVGAFYGPGARIRARNAVLAAAGLIDA